VYFGNHIWWWKHAGDGRIGRDEGIGGKKEKFVGDDGGKSNCITGYFERSKSDE